ncbi:histidine kinase dimerization/phosphoacceptor domain-containing protein, partial [Streptomyces sp. T-3]|nr:histidine kinase dimerization/phosphoacceptor domain-containing protein [Streptomyces sp. T-3]
MEAVEAIRRPRLSERVLRVVNRDPRDAPHQRRTDALLMVGAGVFSLVFALWSDDGRVPDALGWVLLAGSLPPVLFRRRHALPALLVLVAAIVPYHAMDNAHAAPMVQTWIMLYSLGATSTGIRAAGTGIFLVCLSVTIMLTVDTEKGAELLRTSGWILAVLFLGADVRIYRQYVASIVERAERAERSREEEAARRVAEERLRIARDLHDLLAHSITLIGVQTSVASHVLTVDPDRLDRAAISQALDGISETCRTARGELRATLEVLRADIEETGRGPLPGLDGLPDLAAAARTAGA